MYDLSACFYCLIWHIVCWECEFDLLLLQYGLNILQTWNLYSYCLHNTKHWVVLINQQHSSLYRIQCNDVRLTFRLEIDWNKPLTSRQPPYNLHKHYIASSFQPGTYVTITLHAKSGNSAAGTLQAASLKNIYLESRPRLPDLCLNLMITYVTKKLYFCTLSLGWEPPMPLSCFLITTLQCHTWSLCPCVFSLQSTWRL